jgi:PAS domain S-box-containing protein
VLLLGLEELPDECWSVLLRAGIRLERVADVAAAVRALTDQGPAVVIAGARWARELTAAVRGRRDLASAHIVVGAALDSPPELREALDAGVDDVIRVPFEPEVLVARVAAGLRAARLRASEALLHSLVANIPGALYRGAWDADWTMEWISDEIERITGYPAADFINCSVRTFASVIHPDDRELVERSVLEAAIARRPFALEYRIQRRDGEVRWVLERGQAQESGDGRRWLDGAIFDVTFRRAAERALRDREVAEAQLAEVRASRARIVDAADRARREIERNLHDGAQQLLVSLALTLRLVRLQLGKDPAEADRLLAEASDELQSAIEELRELARGIHPAVLADRGLGPALEVLASHAHLPVKLSSELGARLPLPVEAAVYYVAAEGLTNIAKYARATSATVRVQRVNASVVLQVGDDGAGGADPGRGTGLRGLTDRVEALGGKLELHSPPGQGTLLTARIPCGE